MGGAEGLVEVVADVGYVFDAHRDADVFGADAGRELFGFGELLVGSGGRVDDEGFGIAEVGEVAGELNVIDQSDARLFAAFDAKADDRAGSAGDVFFGVGMVGMAG